MVQAVSTIPVEKFRAIARTLLEKTKAKQVNWVRSRKSNPDPPATTYEVVLPQSRLVLTYGMPRAEPDFISLQMQNSTGTTVDSWSVDDPESNDDADWRLLRELFMQVHLVVTGWDSVLSDVEKALASNDPIGTKPATIRQIIQDY